VVYQAGYISFVGGINYNILTDLKKLQKTRKLQEIIY